MFQIIKDRTHIPKQPTQSFEGQTILVTGSTGGIGYATASKFVSLNASKVILAVRNAEKGEKAKQEIEKANNRKDCVEVWSLDMVSYDSIKALAQKAANLPHLDVAVLNAGLMKKTFEKLEYGWEETFQVNTLSTTLLILLLLPLMKPSSPKITPTMVIVNSNSHRGFKIEQFSMPEPLHYYNNRKNFSTYGHYALSKLFQMICTKYISSLPASCNPAGVKIVAVCPGACASDLAREHTDHNFVIRTLLVGAHKIMFRTAEEGSRSNVSAISEGENGGFWRDDINYESEKIFQGESGKLFIEKGWKEVKEALRKDVPEVIEEFDY